MQFDGKINELEDLLRTDYHIFTHKETNLKDVACEKYVIDGYLRPPKDLALTKVRYHIPAQLQKHVDYITPGIRLREGRFRDGSKMKKRDLRIGDRTTQSSTLLPDISIEGVQADPLANCSNVSTPACIRGKFKLS
jgi:tripeptidyl-peptidase-1